jgi:hypothetical protein
MTLRPFATIIDYLSEVKLDVSEVIEKVTNSLKLIGDPYLARVYTRQRPASDCPPGRRACATSSPPSRVFMSCSTSARKRASSWS